MELNTYGIKKSREERRYSVPQQQQQHNGHSKAVPQMPPASEDLHAWSIYRQNLNSDFTDSALGSSDKSPLPYGNFQLRDTTVHSILNHPRYGPKSSLGSNMYTYLKFGLPRVFPPNESQRYHRSEQAPSVRGRVNRAFRDSNAAGSSGYDSSDNENGTSRRSRPVPANLRKYRSESDFRTLGNMSPMARPDSSSYRNIPLTALKQPNSRASIAGTNVNNFHSNNRYQHTRSHSEADLLANDAMVRNGSEAFYDYDQRVHSDARTTKPDQYAIMSRRHSSMLLYPNIVVRGLDVNSEIRGVSFQAKAGDLFAIMATSQKDGTALIETLAGITERFRGDILINGQHVSKALLREICGYVAAPNIASLDPRMSVQNTLSFHAALKGPADRSDLKERIDILVEDLGLTAVRSANISRLTHSEKQRLNVACQLLTQCPILILDQATTNMDIFDTFFLVEYLRQWGDAGRIVIMTLQPPTFEILSMCSGVLLLSGGKTIFSGPRSELPKHMGSLGYPCPPFKNPADYYLDLVTLDDLSAAALLESSARIESLANAWDRMNSEIPLPPPVANLPEVSIKSGVLTQFNILCKRFITYTQPGSLLSWISKLILAAILSLFIGCIFWDIPNSDPQLTFNDRLGYHHCLMVVAIWPMLLLFMRDIQNDREFAEKDIRLGLYSRFVYIFVQNILRIIPSLFIWLVYLLPAHSMSALYSYDNDNGIYIYIGFMLLYLMTLQTISAFITYLSTSNNLLATSLLAIMIIILSSVGNYMVHPQNIPNYLTWLSYVSPQKWLLPLLTKDEYSDLATASYGGLQLCRNKQVQHQEIIVQQQCPQPNGTAIQYDFNILPTDHILSDNPEDMFGSTFVALVLSNFCFFVLTVLVFIFNTKPNLKSKNY